MYTYAVSGCSLVAVCLTLMATGCISNREQHGGADAVEVSLEVEPAASSDDIQTRILAAHNAWREKVNVPPLQWSDTLAAYAQDWADTLRDRGCALEHRADNAYGENLAWASGTRLPPERVVDMWGEEEAFYDYDTNTCDAGKVCGHYTQVVWRTTEAVGCARTRCEDNEVWVCNYDPPGNWVGEKPY